jgi:sugar O-acyltransferase (sialic acid O-acetyltransferase NeuD family)
MKLYGIVGAGGFGREVMPLVDQQLQKKYPDKNYRLVFVTEEVSYLPIINDYLMMNINEFINLSADEKYFNIAIANFESRRRIAHLMSQFNITPFSIYAFNHINLGHSEINVGAIFCHFTFISPNATIGKFFHANIYSYIAHDCIIGDFVTFAPKVCCNGGVFIEDDVYVGTGAIIKQSIPNKPIIIGKGAVIGMGAVVTKSVSPYTTVVGNPASPLVKKEIMNG